MLRELTFWIGGAIAIALGAALAAGLLWAGAGLVYFDAWLAVPLAVVLGVFFLHVGSEMRRYRTQYLRAAEAGEPLPPGGPPL